MITAKKISLLVLLIFLQGCSIIPGIKDPKGGVITSGFELTEIIDISPEIIEKTKPSPSDYTIQKGDELSIVVYAQNEIFPITSAGASSPYIIKVVGADGQVFFPFVGTILVEGLTINEIRIIVREKLKNSFNDPQVDVQISKYNPRRSVYVVGEVLAPGTISIGRSALTLKDALSQARGLSPVTSDPSSIYVIRKEAENAGIVFRADMTNASMFSYSGEFSLQPGDVIYVGPSDITKWNRFITQLFPFASLATQLDNFNNN